MYDKWPYIPVSPSGQECCIGWHAIGESLRNIESGERSVVYVECYPGEFVEDISNRLKDFLKPSLIVSTEALFLSSTELDKHLAPILTEDPVFGVMNGIEIEDYLDPEEMAKAQEAIYAVRKGVTLVIGTGAARVAPQHDVLVYADLA